VSVADSSRTSLQAENLRHTRDRARQNIERASKACIVLAVVIFGGAFVATFLGVYVVDLGMKSDIAQILGAGVATTIVGLVGLVLRRIAFMMTER
jgi:nitrate reductase gamma subunit